MHFDLLIKGGEVVDPEAGYGGRLDVAIKRGRVAAVERDIPREAAFRVVEAGGHYVTPGLVDLHTHVYWGCTYWGIHADPVASRTGVTTWLDVGSSGAFGLPGFREFIVKPSSARIYALLNISYVGLTGPTYELANLDYCDVALFETMVNQNRDLVLGVKARIDRNTTRGTGLAPLERARQAADACELPLMVHIGQGPPEIRDVLSHMKPGDILTHCFTGHSMRIVGDDGKLLDAARRVWDAGVIMDIGHGAGSFSFETAEKMLAAGHKPDVISSDIHQASIGGPMFDLPTCLSKFLALGMALPDVIRAATSRPAQVMGMAGEVGTLKPGARADVAVFALQRGRFALYDVFMNRRDSTQLLRNTATIVGGRVLPRLAPEPPAPWMSPTESQRRLVREGQTPEAWASSPAAPEPAVAP